MQALAAGQGEAADQRLADQLVGESEAGLGGPGAGGRGTFIGGDDEVGALGLVDGVQEEVGVAFGQLFAADRR